MKMKYVSRVANYSRRRIRQTADRLCLPGQRRRFARASVDVPKVQELDLRRGTSAPILVVSAHADDEALGCAGIIDAHRRQGTPVVWVVVLDGRRATGGIQSEDRTADARRYEAERVAKICHWGELRWLGLQGIVGGCEVQRRMADLLAKVKPSVVYAPFAYNHHPEHRWVAEIMAETVPHHTPLRAYAIQTPLTPVFANRIYSSHNLPVMTSRLIECYPSQAHMWRSFQAVLSLQELEGILFGVSSPVQTLCEIPMKDRKYITRQLSEAAASQTPCKPNLPNRLWEDYHRLWEQAIDVADALGWPGREGGTRS